MEESLSEIIHWFYKPLLQIGLIVFITGLVYLNSLPNQFVLDDQTFLSDWTLTHDLKNLPLFFTGTLPHEHLGDYRPVKGIVLSLNYALFKDNPIGYHVQALVIHLISVILVYFIARALIQRLHVGPATRVSLARVTRMLVLFPFISALIFALHPLNVEAVAFLTASSDTLGIVFYLGSFLCFVRSLKSPRLLKEHSGRTWRLLSVFLFLLGLLTYEMVLTLPIMATLYLGCFYKRPGIKGFLPVVPLYLVLILYLVFRFSVLHVYYEEGYFLGSFASTLAIMTVAAVKYLTLLVFPWALSVNHQILPGIYAYVGSDVNQAAVRAPAFTDPVVLASLLTIGCVLFLAFKYGKKEPLLSFGILWIGIALLPVSNLFPIPVLMSERYAYLATVGYAMVVGWVFIRLPRWLRLLRVKREKETGVAVICLVLGFYFVRSYLRISDWRDSKALWSATISQVPGSMMVNHNLGMAYFGEGNLEKAITHLRFASDHNYGNVAKVHLNLGKAYLAKKDLKRALGEFMRSVSIREDFHEGHFYLGNVYLELSEYDKAQAAYQKTLSLKPLYFDAYRQLGVLEVRRGNVEAAIEQYEQVIAINPLVIPAYYDIAALYIKLGKLDEARGVLEKGLTKDPGSQVLREAWEVINSSH